MLEAVVDFVYLLQIFWKYSIYYIIFMWQNFIYHPTNYKMTKSVLGLSVTVTVLIYDHYMSR